MSTIKSSTTTTTAYSVTADTTGTLVLQTGATPTTAVTIDTSQNTTFAGTATATKLIPTGTSVTGNGLYLPAANALGLSTNGTNAVYIDASQNVGIGTSSPGSKLQVAAPNGGIIVSGGSGTATNLYLAANGNTAGTTSFDVIQGGDSNGYIYNRANGAINFGTNNTQVGGFTAAGVLQFNSGYGSAATAYGCRAWCNFDGTLTGTISPRASGGVTSVTKNATGDYTVNLSFTMPDINYSVALVANASYGVDRSCHPALFTNISAATESTPTTTSFKVGFATAAGGGGQDLKYICVSVFR